MDKKTRIERARKGGFGLKAKIGKEGFKKMAIKGAQARWGNKGRKQKHN